MGSFSHKCVYVFAIYLLSPNPRRSPPGAFIKNVDVPVRVRKLAGWTEVNCWVKVEFLLGFSTLLLSCTAQVGTLFFEDGYTKNLLTFDLCHWRSFFFHHKKLILAPHLPFMNCYWLFWINIKINSNNLFRDFVCDTVSWLQKYV